jgi:calcineurin-like phosphoesterase family protein
MIYFISDTHFNHDREFVYGPRGFESIGEMNEALIKNWNETVTDEDDIYVLGDFFLGTNEEFIHETLMKLNGQIHLIYGNHDTPKKIELYENTCKNIKCEGYATKIKYKKREFYLSHYPTLTASLEQDPNRAVINLFGHTHSKEKFYEDRPYMYNVAADAHDNRPVSIDTIINDFNEKIKECVSFLGEES